MIKAIRVDDFTGGLNLDANVFRLASNETGDALNVDFNPKGGVSTRWGFTRLNSSALNGATAGTLKPLRLYGWDNSSRRLMIATETEVLSYPSTTNGYANSDNTGIDTNALFGAGFASWDEQSTSTLYVSCGDGYNVSKIVGTTVSTLTASGTGAWQNDLTNPNGTHAPRGELIVAHLERLWIADTYENGVSYPNRLRFSHPLFPESWREDDYIDLVAGGPRITAIVPFGGTLFVFKDNAIFAIYGFNEETFQVVDISRHLGAISTNCVVATEKGIYFYSIPDGVFFYDGKEIKDIFAPIRPLLIDSEITEGAILSMTMGWSNNRLYLSLPSGNDVVNILGYNSTVEDYDDDEFKYEGYVQASTPTKTFVYDETVGSGAWTIYRTSDGFGLVSPCDFLNPDGEVLHVAAHPYQPVLLGIDKRENGSTDNITGTASNFESYFKTSWQDAKNVSSKKFWRRPEIIFRKDTVSSDVQVYVYHDWDTYNSVKNFSVTAPQEDPNAPWDSWGPPEFGASSVYADSLGLARSVQLKIYNNGSDPWALYSIVYKYNPRKTRI